jgi:transmembrane sensor
MSERMRSAEAGVLHDPELGQAALVWAERVKALPDDIETLGALADWLDENPAHADAYARTVRALDAAGQVRENPRVMAMREEALAVGGGVADWAGRALAASAVFAAACVALVAALMAGGEQDASWLQDAPFVPRAQDVASLDSRVYRTERGERRDVTLEDGSVVTLNTDTRILVRYTEDLRHIVLFAGQAHFDVARDETRPFRVRAGSQLVTALGTAFDVRVEAESVSVLLVEGLVEVEEYRHPRRGAAEEAAPPPPVALVAGEQITVSRGGAEQRVDRADVERVTSWREGRVIFENETLPGAVREVNRYLSSPIRIEGDVSDLRVSGVFRTGQTDSFLAAIESAMPVEVRRGASGDVVIAPLG